MTPYERFAPYLRWTLEEQRRYGLLLELGVDIEVQEVLASVAAGSITTVHALSGEERVSPIDTVVLVTQRTSDCEIYDSLSEEPDRRAGAGIKGVYLIGDAHTPSIIAQAVFSGHRLAREIDSPDRSVALPFIRERRLLRPRADDYALDGGAIRSDVPAVVGGADGRRNALT